MSNNIQDYIVTGLPEGLLSNGGARSRFGWSRTVYARANILRAGESDGCNYGHSRRKTGEKDPDSHS